MISGLRNIQILNLSGVLLSLFAFAFGPWLGQRQSGLGVLIELWQFLSSPTSPTDTSRQQTIFIILVILTLCLLGQAIALYMTMGKNNSRWVIAEAVLSLTALGLLGILYSYYQAQTTGVIVTALGTLIAGACALSMWLTARQDDRESDLDRPTPVADEILAESDPKLDFQRQVTKQFLACTNEGKNFTLILIGIAHYEGYATVFGDDEARELTQALTGYIHELYTNSTTTGFSVGAVMVALPEAAQITAIIETLTSMMRQHGFTGEMFLPNGQIELIGSAATYPANGDNIGKLMESVVSSYGEVYESLKVRS
ncbi:MAG: hypothetical protein KDJ65_02440 [Anaerolineae bacterium]|nr:hypothetical protein [Anaerolineae bacterium]